MSKRDKEIEEAAERGREDRERRIENENAAGSVLRTVVGPDIWYNPPTDPEEKAAYDDAYYNR